MFALTKTHLLELITHGENSGVAFKRDEVQPESLAKELVAFGNFEGGRILLGIDDDGTISGLQYSAERDYRQIEEWVMQVCRAHVQPGVRLWK